MDDNKDYGFLSEDIYKVEYLQQEVQNFIDRGIANIDPYNPTPEERSTLIEYFHNFYALMEYQSILYSRLKLMKDSQLQGLEDAIHMVCDALGRSATESIMEFHLEMKEECKSALTDLTGEDMDSYDGIDVEFKW